MNGLLPLIRMIGRVRLLNRALESGNTVKCSAVPAATQPDLQLSIPHSISLPPASPCKMAIWNLRSLSVLTPTTQFWDRRFL